MRKKSGFSLIEVMVAAVIFSLAMVGLSSVFVAGNKHIIHTRERIASAEIGKFFLDPLQALVREDTWASNGLGVDVPLSAAVSQTINNRTFTETHKVDSVAGVCLRRVTSKIQWDEPQS